MPVRQPFHCILPPDLLDRLARAGDEVVRNAALDTMQFDRLFRLTRADDSRGDPEYTLEVR